MALYPRIPLSTLLEYDKTILDGMYFPEHLQDFISYFQLEYGEFTPIYQKPDLLKEHIRVTAIHLKPIIDSWLAVLEQEYDPLETYLRVTDRSDVRTPGLTDTKTTTHGKGETITGGHTDTRDPHNIEHQVSADNTSNYYESELTKEDTDKTVRTYQQEKTQESGTTTVTDILVGTDTNTRDETVHGKPGWFSNQDLLKQELDARRFDIMVEAGRLYAEELLILIY